MAFPSIASRVTGGTGAVDASPIDIPIQAGLVGQRILAVAAFDQNPVVTINTGLSGSNWTEFPKNAYFNAVSSRAYWKIAEGGDVLSLDLSAPRQASWSVIRMDGGFDISASSINSSSSDGDPPLLTPVGGIGDYLWIAVRAGDAAVVATAAPSGYGNLESLAGGGGGASISTAWRTNNAASEDPGPFTNLPEQQVLWTFAISPVQSISVSITATSTLTAVASIGSPRPVSISAQSILQAVARVVKARSIDVISTSSLQALRAQTSPNALLDSSGFVIFDSSMNSIDATDALTSTSRQGLINAVSSLAAARRVLRPATATVVSTSAVLADPRTIRNRAVGITGSSTISLVSVKSIFRAAAVLGKSSAVAAYEISGTSHRVAFVASVSSVASASTKVTSRQVGITASAIVDSVSSKDASVKLSMFAGSVISVSRKLIRRSLASVVTRSTLSAVPRKSILRQTASAAVSSMDARRGVVRGRTASITASTVSSLLPTYPRNRSVGISAMSLLSVVANGTTPSATRVARIGQFVNNHTIKVNR